MAEIKNKNLALRLAELQWSAQEVQKSGKNTNYDYKTFTNIKKAIILKMRELGLSLIPGELPKEERDFKIEQVSNARYRVSYFTKWHLLCGETNEERAFVFPSIGTNTDAEKANGAAVTYELKYIFNILGLIPDESLDPDEVATQKEQKTKSAERQELLNELMEVKKELDDFDGSGGAYLKLLLGLEATDKVTQKIMIQLTLEQLKEFIAKFKSTIEARRNHKLEGVK